MSVHGSECSLYFWGASPQVSKTYKASGCGASGPAYERDHTTGPIRDRRGLRDFDVAVGRFGEPTGYMTARICAGSAVTRLWPPTEMSKRIVS